MIRSAHLAFIVWIVAAFPAAAATFSVYLTPRASSPTSPHSALEVRDDIHIDVAGKAIPLSLKAARQSIAYPCVAGGTIEFFRQIEKDGQIHRERLGSARVPASAANGLVVLAPGDESLAVTAMWWSAAELRDGHGICINLAGRDVAIACGGSRVRLESGKRWSFAMEFPDQATLAPVRVEIFAPTDAGGLTRLLDQSVAVPKNDTGIFLILPKLERYVTILPIEAAGARDPVATGALREVLAVGAE